MEVSKHHALNGPGYNAKRIFDRHASFPLPGVGIFHCEVNITAASYLCHQVILKSFLSCRDHITLGNPQRHEEPKEETNERVIFHSYS